METALLNLPIIFCFFTGFLISWAGFLVMEIQGTTSNVAKTENTPKLWCLSVLYSTISILLLLLFFFTEFAAFHMSTIIFLEIWYMMFLYRVSYTQNDTPCRFVSSNNHDKHSSKKTITT